MNFWNNIKLKGVPEDIPCEVKNIDGKIYYGCGHSTQFTSGIIKLDREGDSFKWDGQTHLIKITHWKYAE